MQQEDVFESLSRERAYQDQKWGDLDDSNNVADFLAYMKRYFDKAFEDNNPKYPEFSMEHIRKITALGVAAMEKFGDGLAVRHVTDFRGHTVYSTDRKLFEVSLFWVPPVDRKFDGVFIEGVVEHNDGSTYEVSVGFVEKMKLSLKSPLIVAAGTKSVTFYARSISKDRIIQPLYASTPRVKLQIVP